MLALTLNTNVLNGRPYLIFRTYRYSSYRQFTWWVHNRLGRHVRRIIPSCAINRIRAEFEEDDGNYTCFEGTDAVASEIVKAMEWNRVDEQDNEEGEKEQ